MVDTGANIYEAKDKNSNIVAKKRHSSVVSGTRDGEWLKLDDGEGYMLIRDDTRNFLKQVSGADEGDRQTPASARESSADRRGRQNGVAGVGAGAGMVDAGAGVGSIDTPPKTYEVADRRARDEANRRPSNSGKVSINDEPEYRSPRGGGGAGDWRENGRRREPPRDDWRENGRRREEPPRDDWRDNDRRREEPPRDDWRENDSRRREEPPRGNWRENDRRRGDEPPRGFARDDDRRRDEFPRDSSRGDDDRRPDRDGPAGPPSRSNWRDDDRRREREEPRGGASFGGSGRAGQADTQQLAQDQAPGLRGLLP
jgi:hypothetical protein